MSPNKSNSIFNFIKIKENLKSGQSYVCKKSKSAFYYFTRFSLAPLHLCIWLIPSLFGVRVLGTLHQRIGHLLLEIDCLLKEVQLGRKKRRFWLVLVQGDDIANPAFLELLPANIKFQTLPRYLLALIRKPIVGYTSCYQYATSIYSTATCYSINANWGNRDPIFSCPTKWSQSRKSYFEAWGIPQNAKYVCIHVREGGYSPTDEYMHESRNSHIEDLIPTIDYLIAQGFYVIRMGDPSVKPAPQLKFLIDYAHSPDRQNWLDLAISAECTLFLGCSSGAVLMASIFGRPVATVNMCLPFAFSATGAHHDLGIPRLFRRKSTGNLVHLSEVFATGASEYRFAQEIIDGPYDLVTNSPEEILELAREMLLRINGEWIENEYDKILQSRIHSLLKPGSYSYGTASRCGTAFLRKYQDLLPDLD